MAKYREPLLVALLALFLAVLVHHVLMTVYGDDFRASINASLSLLDGRPHWRLFQNRVLGPFLARTFMRVSPTPDLGFMLLEFICFGTAFVLAWRAGQHIIGNRAGALAATLTLALGLVSLFIPHWFYAWDVLGLPLYMGFAWLIVSGAGDRAIALLFAVAIWNRDDALFIALFLTIRPIADWWRVRSDPARPAIAWRQVAVGVACMAAGVALIRALRALLLVTEAPPAVIWTEPTQTPWFQWDAIHNLDYVFRGMSLTVLEAPAFVLLPPLVIIAACCYLARANDGRYLSYALVNLAMVAATLMFALINEMRIWVDLLPPVVLATCLWLARAGTAAPTPPL